jgi:hypothetical protein
MAARQITQDQFVDQVVDNFKGTLSFDPQLIRDFLNNCIQDLSRMDAMTMGVY